MNAYSMDMRAEFETCVTIESPAITSKSIGKIGHRQLRYSLFLRLTRSEEEW